MCLEAAVLLSVERPRDPFARWRSVRGSQQDSFVLDVTIQSELDYLVTYLLLHDLNREMAAPDNVIFIDFSSMFFMNKDT